MQHALCYMGFFPTLDQRIIEYGFRQAIQTYGVPEAVYFDNGTQYRTKWMSLCAKLGSRLLFAKPYSPEATGKVERFNRVVDGFLDEVALEKPKTLDELNERFAVKSQHKPHTVLGENTSPEMAFRSDCQTLRFEAPETIVQAFLHCESRKVDKSGCLSFMGKKYEVGLSFIGCKVDVVHDPADITELTIEYEGHTSWNARQLVIGRRAGKRPNMPEHVGVQPAESSRLLSAAKAQHDSLWQFRTVRRKKGEMHMFEAFYELKRTPFSRDIPPR